jgi:hypothetical protein
MNRLNSFVLRNGLESEIYFVDPNAIRLSQKGTKDLFFDCRMNEILITVNSQMSNSNLRCSVHLIRMIESENCFLRKDNLLLTEFDLTKGIFFL